jgi:hypothetical protein
VVIFVGLCGGGAEISNFLKEVLFIGLELLFLVMIVVWVIELFDFTRGL